MRAAGGGTPASQTVEVRDADVVVVGAGAAGLSVALRLAGRRVDLVAKGRLGATGSSPWAQGGIAGAVGPTDSPALHARDTLAVGGELGDPAAVARLTSEGPLRLAELVALGARFDRDARGGLDLAREAAHSRARVLHARDATGAELVRALGSALAGRSGLAVFEGALALELVMQAGRVAGVLVRHEKGTLVLHFARAVVLATGGIGQLFSRTTNPVEATGDGLALAWRAGARLADLEFVQFHPTALDVGSDPMPLLTEALRGAGAVLVDADGRRIRAQGGGPVELLPRDVVARALWAALAAGRRPRLDARGVESLGERFPTVLAACLQHGLDPRVQPIPVAPAAHYHMGGIAVDLGGRTSVRGLWAAGEVACTGVHGANRLASNSLLEALVFGDRVARSIAEALPKLPAPAARARVKAVEALDAARPGGLTLGGGGTPAVAGRFQMPAGTVASLTSSSGAPVTSAAAAAAAEATARAEIRRLMWERAGLVRTGEGLRDALARLDALPSTIPAGAGETGNLLSVARLVATAALARTESRGAHFRADHPRADPAWRRRILLTPEHGSARIETEPVAVEAGDVLPVEVCA